MKIREIRLQNGIFVYKAGISFTKWDFHLQRETLGLQTGLSLYISPKKSMPLLYLFIERYKNSDLKEISQFANGLGKDIEAVNNSVASELSNGFVEETNSKLKMVKRTMYGRCYKTLLAARLMYTKFEWYRLAEEPSAPE